MKLDDKKWKHSSAVAVEELKRYDEAFFKTDNVNDIYKQYFLSPNNVTVDPEGSQIIPFFKGKQIFLTGATGFVGVLTVEKLLRACPDIGRIYLLVRNKKNRDVKARMEKYFQCKAFDPLRKMYPNFQEKVTAVNGDIAANNLGLTDNDRKLLIENVNIIINSAATVNFDEKFRIAVNVNVRGTKHMLDLAKECKKLLIFVHISTAFSTTNHQCVKEEINDYKTADIDEIFDIVKQYPDEELEIMSKKYLGDFSNNYSFTKHLAEYLVKQHMKELPIVVFRPSMILTTYREPLRGWTNNIYGPMALMFLSGIGLQHVILTYWENCSDTVPADYVVNGLIAVTYKASQDRSYCGKVYNFVNRPSVQYSFGEAIQFTINSKDKLVSNVCKLHAYNFLTTKNVRLFLFLGFFFHTIPAIILDFILKIIGIKVPIKITDAMNKLHKLLVKTTCYNKYQWKFEYGNVDKLWQEMAPADMNAFPFNVHEVNPKLHMISILAGLRTYMANDPLNTLDAARKSYYRIEKIFYAAYAFFVVVILICFKKFYNFVYS